MAKAILVLERMPERCFDCPFRTYSVETVCVATGKLICGIWEHTDQKEGRPDWCPLRVLPEKEGYNPDIHPCYEPFDEGYIEGWNDCVDAIEETEE